jgi:hypothetical protein
MFLLKSLLLALAAAGPAIFVSASWSPAAGLPGFFPEQPPAWTMAQSSLLAENRSLRPGISPAAPGRPAEDRLRSLDQAPERLDSAGSPETAGRKPARDDENAVRREKLLAENQIDRMKRRSQAYDDLERSITGDSEAPAVGNSGTARSDAARRQGGKKRRDAAGSPGAGGRKPARGNENSVRRERTLSESQIDRMQKRREAYDSLERSIAGD